MSIKTIHRRLFGVMFCFTILFLTISTVPGEITLHQPYCSNINSQSSGDTWSMFRGNLEHTGFSASTAPNSDTILWSYSPPVNSWFAESSPAVSNEKVYIGACAVELNPIAGRLYCLDEFDGSVQWTYSTDAWIISSPAVADGKVYAASFFDGTVHCLDADDGDFVWSYAAAYQIFSSPAVTNENVYIGSVDFQENRGEVLCLDATDGHFIWRYTPGDGVYSSPAVSNGRVYVGSVDGKLYCLNAGNGSLIWSYNTGSWVRSSPAVVNNKVYVGSGNGKIYCLDSSNGDKLWNYTTSDSIGSSPAIADGKLYIGSYDTNVYCLDALTGNHIWNYSTDQSVYASPAVADGKVYVGSGNMSPPAGKLNCLDALTGECLWYLPTDSVAHSSPAIASSKVYMSSSDGSLYCLCDNLPPDKPSRPSGSISGEPGVVYNYSTSTTDPNGDDIRYGWDWNGDKEVDEWTSFYPSGVTVTTSHSWEHMGIRLVRVKAEDTSGFQSEWSKPLLVITPKEQYVNQHGNVIRQLLGLITR
jgi:outer membrane protein assembly factor BamB